MDRYGEEFRLPLARLSNRELIEGLRNALNSRYSRVVTAARNQWESNFGVQDPSDSCVSVRISTRATATMPRIGCN